MDVFTMAAVAHRRTMNGGEDRTDLMSDMGVAIGTFDLVIRHMILVQELRRVFGRQEFRLIMALDAFSLRHMTVPLNDVRMASLTGDASGNVLPVIEIPSLDFDISLGFNMAGGTSANRTGNTLLLPSRTRLIIMTDETVDLMNREMGSLDELRMASRAAEFHSSSQLA
jgi:hypothetical protein